MTLILLLFLFAISSVWALGPTHLWKKTFTSQILDASGGLTPVVITEKEITAMGKEDKTDEIRSLARDQSAVMSAQGDIFAVTTHRPQVMEMVEKIEVFALDGNSLCVIKENGLPFISPDGKWFIIASKAENRLSFYGRNGKLLGKHDFSDIRNFSLAFSGDGDYCAVNIPNIQDGSKSGFLVLFDRKGKKMWRFDHPGSTMGKVAVSKNAMATVYSSENDLFSISRKGKLNWKKSTLAGGISITVSKEAKFIALCRREDNSVSLYDAYTGGLIWNKKIGGLLGFNSPFTSLDVLDDGTVFATLSKSWSLKNDASYLYVLRDNQIIWSEVFNQPSIRAKIDDNGRVITVIAKDFIAALKYEK